MSIDHPSFGKLDDDRIIIFDTTLRDGEQSPGFSMNINEKIRMAEALTELGIDVMEAGFPIASPGDFESVKAIAESIGQRDDSPVICGLARSGREDILRAAEAVRPAKRKRIHSFISTSPLHMKYKLRMEPDEVLQAVTDSVDPGPPLHRRRRVVGRGRHPHRARLPVPLRRGRDQGRRHHDQHPRHGRLRAARGHGAHLHHGPRPRAGRRQGGAVHAQPQRSGPGGRQHAGGDPRRRAAGGVHHQRHRRARRQCLAGRSGDGDPHPQRRRAVQEQHQDAEHPARVEAALHHHRLRRAAQQGDRRPQRLRPRGRHPPGRRAEARRHLRDHDCRRASAGQNPAW